MVVPVVLAQKACVRLLVPTQSFAQVSRAFLDVPENEVENTVDSAKLGGFVNSEKLLGQPTRAPGLSALPKRDGDDGPALHQRFFEFALSFLPQRLCTSLFS